MYNGCIWGLETKLGGQRRQQRLGTKKCAHNVYNNGEGREGLASNIILALSSSYSLVLIGKSPGNMTYTLPRLIATAFSSRSSNRRCKKAGFAYQVGSSRFFLVCINVLSL